MGVWGLVLLVLIWLFIKAVAKGESAGAAKKEGDECDFSSEMQDDNTVDLKSEPVKQNAKAKNERVRQEEFGRKTTMQVETQSEQTEKKSFLLRDAVIYSAILNRPHK